MTVQNSDVERRSSYCPNCIDTRGEVTTVTFGAVVRTISYKCRECGQEWLVQAPVTAADAHEVR